MQQLDEFLAHLTQDVSTNVYLIPGIMAFLQHPQKGLSYIQGEMTVGLIVSVVMGLASAYLLLNNFKHYFHQSVILTFSLVWLIFLNLAALLPKFMVFTRLRKVRREQNNAELRVALINVFRKRFYAYNLRLSLMNVASYLVSLPIGVYLWQTGVPECVDLLAFSMIYILRLFFNIYRYHSYFLETSAEKIAPDNPYGFDLIVYRKEELKDSHPRLVDDICSICMNEYEENDKVLQFSCAGGHYFHQECINKWMGHKSICPLCKHGIH